MKDHEDFLQSIKKGKDIWDTNGVEKSLLKRAMGFEYEETIEMYAGRGTDRRTHHFIKSVTIFLNKEKRLRGYWRALQCNEWNVIIGAKLGLFYHENG